MQKFITSWSGGKDSCFAFMETIKAGGQAKVLMNMMNENGLVSRSHAIPEIILKQQAFELGLPIITVPSTWKEYERNFIVTLTHLAKEYQLDAAVFGDIDFESNRQWEEKVCLFADIHPCLPLWKQDRKELVLKMISQGIHCIIVSCNDLLGKKFLGRKLDEELVNELEHLGVDVCGENGEYHTLVLNCPLFKNGLNIGLTGKNNYNKYWFQEMILN